MVSQKDTVKKAAKELKDLFDVTITQEQQESLLFKNAILLSTDQVPQDTAKKILDYEAKYDYGDLDWIFSPVPEKNGYRLEMTIRF